MAKITLESFWLPCRNKRNPIYSFGLLTQRSVVKIFFQISRIVTKISVVNVAGYDGCHCDGDAPRNPVGTATHPEFPKFKICKMKNLFAFSTGVAILNVNNLFNNSVFKFTHDLITFEVVSFCMFQKTLLQFDIPLSQIGYNR